MKKSGLAQQPVSSPAWTLAAAMALGILALYAGLSAFGNWKIAPWPFVWPDVAVVYGLSLLPLLACSYDLLRAGSKPNVAALAASALVLFAIPSFYIHVRVQNSARRARELTDESRFGEARLLLSQILGLRPDAHWQGVNLRQADERLQAIIEPLAARVAIPLMADATCTERLARARDLAMLGRADRALDTLADSSACDDLPDACNLRGAIFEARGNWRTARRWYARSESLLTATAALRQDPATQTALAKALAGLGHCERKLGNPTQAEAAYQKLLAAAPTAETHYLLAQFYDDTQETKLAALHARRAAQLAPEQFQERSRQLLDRLATSHFGCFLVSE